MYVQVYFSNTHITCACLSVCACLYVRVRVVWCVHRQKRINTEVYIPISSRICAYTETYIYICTHIHVYVHIMYKWKVARVSLAVRVVRTLFGMAASARQS